MAMRVPDLWSQGPAANLLVINYHRIWARGQLSSEFDDGVFDVDVDTFRLQMQWLRNSTRVLDEEGLLQLVEGVEYPEGELLSAVTFDDGYVDCYTLAKPVLDDLGIRALFFIPVRILQGRQLGWWDIAAYILKKSVRQSVTLRGNVYPLASELSRSLKRILNIFKLEPAERTSHLLEEIAEACGVEPPSPGRQDVELMTWDQVRDLAASGHAVGSHAWSHRPLATLTPDEQAREICDARDALQTEVGRSITSFAYPVGGPSHFNDTSVRLVREAGHRMAFSFNTGIAELPVTDPYRLPRESAKSLELLKAKALLPGFMGLRSKSAA
jgi:peptidoglycan/xylan/chitin deacetylase (PgdA/CDA1 family)